MAQSNTKMTQPQKLALVRKLLEDIEEIQSETESLMLLLAGDEALKKEFDDDAFLENMETSTIGLLATIQNYRQELNATCKKCGSDLDLDTRLCTDKTCPYSDHEQHEMISAG